MDEEKDERTQEERENMFERWGEKLHLKDGEKPAKQDHLTRPVP